MGGMAGLRWSLVHAGMDGIYASGSSGGHHLCTIARDGRKDIEKGSGSTICVQYGRRKGRRIWTSAGARKQKFKVDADTISQKIKFMNTSRQAVAQPKVKRGQKATKTFKFRIIRRSKVQIQKCTEKRKKEKSRLIRRKTPSPEPRLPNPNPFHSRFPTPEHQS